MNWYLSKPRIASFARVELRYATIRLKDGLAGTAEVNQPVTPPADGNTGLTVNTVSLNTSDTDHIPVGGRFTIAGETDTEAVHTVLTRTGNPTTSITFTPALGPGTYSGSGAAILGTAATSVPGDGSTDEVQTIAAFGNTVVSGNYTLTLTLAGDSPVTTANIVYNANAAAITSAINSAVSAHTLWTNGDIVVTGGPLSASGITLTFSGTSVTHVNHGQTTINNVSLVATVGDATLTFLPQQVEIKVGDGDAKWTETKNYSYDKDRGNLDVVRQLDEEPVEVQLSFTFERITTGTADVISPMDALKGIGGASEWVTSDTDECQPYSVDVEIQYVPPCSGSSETVTFPLFRYEKAEMSYKDATISITGKCNVTEPEVEAE